MLSALRRAIRNYTLRTIGSEEINDMLENGFNDADKQLLIELLQDQ